MGTSKEEVAAAAARLRPHLAPTPLVESPVLGAPVTFQPVDRSFPTDARAKPAHPEAGADKRRLAPGALLKLETFQPTGSFKVRGALAALSLLDPGTRVVTASAGNHGLGVAWSAALLELDATVVVPETASPAKVAALGRFPARLVQHGETYDDAERHALELADDGSRYVSPYNDAAVIAGGGTVALELLEAVSGPVTIVCPIGGGGLCSGVALWASGRQDTEVVGVVAERSPAMLASLAAGRIVPVEIASTLADGLAGNLEPGSLTFELVRAHVRKVVAVSEEEIEAGMRFLVGAHGLVTEGAGAVATAALLAGKVEPKGRPVALVTGRNIALPSLARTLAA